MSEPTPRFPKVVPELPPIEISRDLLFRAIENRAALDYWRSKCRGRRMPARSEIDPTEMRSFLPYVGLIETPTGTAALPDYRIAVAGAAIEAVLGPLSGRLLQEAVPPVVAKRWRSVYQIVMIEAIPLQAVSRVAFEAKNFLMGELFVAPLSRDSLRIDTLFVSLVFWPETGTGGGGEPAS
jgi:hypothetical protein